MHRIPGSILILNLLLVSGGQVLAQDASIPNIDEVVARPAVPSASPTGNLSCFDYYHFGSVKADLTPTVNKTVPGATLTFSGKVLNQNNYPLLDGTLYVKIFKKEDAVFTAGDGNPIVDQFVIADNITLTPQGDYPLEFIWKVPINAEAGDYYAAYFFTTAKRYNLMGLSFTDDIVGNQAPFSVTRDNDPKLAKLSKIQTSLNGEDHHFVAFPRHFDAGEVVTVSTTITNPTDGTKTLPLQWNQYAWDSMREENLRSTKTELITLKPNETKTVTYEVQQQRESVVYVIATTQDGETKSVLNVRFVRDGIEETRINFPGISTFPLKQGSEATLFACAHAINSPIVPGNTLTLTLKGRDGTTIHEYHYNGDITGAMSGFGESFTPDRDIDYATLTATLERGGVIVEQVSQIYDCQTIDPSSCFLQEDPKSSSTLSKIILFILILGLLFVAAIAVMLYKKRRNHRDIDNTPMITPMTMIFFLLLLPALFLFAPSHQVEAKSVLWSVNEPNDLAYFWNNGAAGQTGWEKGLSAPNITVQYQADVYDNTTNILIADGATIPVGTTIRFQPKAYADCDINWFGSGFSQDSPCGHWIANAAAPTFTCLAGDLSGSGVTDSIGNRYNTYAPLSVNPPSKSFDTTGSTAALTQLSEGVYRVDGPGTIVGNVVFAATNGEFYYRYLVTYKSYLALNLNQCYGNQVAMETITSAIPPPWCISIMGSSCPTSWTYTTEDYSLQIPQQTIPFALTAVGNNQPPAAPVITGPSTGIVNTAYGFTFTASDPDNDTLRYGITDASCVNVTEWLPGAGYVNTGTGQTKNQSWGAPASHTFYVLTEDSKGARSGCTSHTISVSPAPATTVDLKVNGSDEPVTLPAPGNVTVSWTATNAASCNLYGPGFGGVGVPLVGSGSATVNNTDNFILICNGVSDQVTVNVTPPPPPPPNFIPPTFYGISYNNFNQVTNEYGNITATMRVSNYGGSATGITAPYEVRLDGVQKVTGNIPPLVQNEYVDIAVTIPGPITVGGHTLTGEADKGNSVTESNENDNVGDYSITLPTLDPGLSITASPSFVQNNQSSTISWTVGNPYSMSCSVFGPGMTTRNFNPATDGGSGNISAGPITAKSEYTLSCTATGNTFTDHVTVETQGVIEEI